MTPLPFFVFLKGGIELLLVIQNMSQLTFARDYDKESLSLLSQMHCKKEIEKLNQ